IHPKWKDLYYWLVQTIPADLKTLIRMLISSFDGNIASDINNILKLFNRSSAKPPVHELRRWLDFVEWYQGAMTDWVEFWIKTARKYFPKNEIYLVTGGNGKTMLGADFSAQTKIASKYNAGIRITNQNDDYRESFIRTRLVSSASRNYDSYFTTEEAGVNHPRAVAMRIFDAVTSGARGAYFKSIIGTGSNLCGGRNFPPGQPTEGAAHLMRNIHCFSFFGPIIESAIFFPNTSLSFDYCILDSLYNQCSKLRALIDFDLIDENMIDDDLLRKYRFLIILNGNYLRKNTLMKMRSWVMQGGILISASFLELTHIDVNRNVFPELLNGLENLTKLNRGFLLLFKDRKPNYLTFISEAILNRDKKYPWEAILKIRNHQYGQYATQFSNKIMYYDPKKCEIRIRKISNAG
ncbi:MAG: hypothetical protein JSW07_10845, partial [bacterium]